MSETPKDDDKRKFLLAVTSAFTGLGAIFASVPFISSWWPSARVKAAAAPVEADISRLEPGQMMTVEWRGKPVWIIRRTQEMVQALKKHAENLRDPDSKVDQQPNYVDNIYRSIKPEILVLVGICTHLGCVPSYVPYADQLRKGWPGGFYCPCHGSTFDLAGRVFRGVPAPINLQVPPYHFVNENTLLIGENPKHV